MKSIYKTEQRLKADLGLTKNDSLEQNDNDVLRKKRFFVL